MTRVFGTRDTVADVEKLDATRTNLPPSTRIVPIDGGNHSQFGHYGFQPGDWPATISREAQQAITRAALLDALRRPGSNRRVPVPSRLLVRSATDYADHADQQFLICVSV